MICTGRPGVAARVAVIGGLAFAIASITGCTSGVSAPAATSTGPSAPDIGTSITGTSITGTSAATSPTTDGRRPTVAITPFAKVDAPVGVAVRPHDDTLYVISQDGLVTPIDPAGVAAAPVLDITGLTAAGGERGLLGLAFHPTLPLAYIDYTDRDGNTNIVEYHVAADGRFDVGSRRLVLEIDQPYPNHNGGQLTFGPDGLMYIGTGDGGSSGDPQRHALDLAALLGKILRADPVASDGKPYTVPADNPYVGVVGARPEIWSIGLRNPWRFSFDPAGGDLWIADVGQDKWEEVDVAWADQGGGRGTNFGWSAFEGEHRFNQDQPTTGVVGPIFEYPHGDAGCSISGGAMYRGAAIAALVGWYVYGDYCSGEVRALKVADRRVVDEVTLGTPGSVAAVAVGPDGELYVASVGDGDIFKIVPA